MVSDNMIRRATTDDIAGIQRVARQSWRAAYGDFLDEEVIEELLDEGYSGAFLEEALATTEMAFFLAEEGLTVVGFVSCEPPTEGAVGSVSIYVSPEYWGDGIGTALLERAESYLDAKGADAMQDTVLADNEVGNAFYQNHFERAGETTVEMGGEEFDGVVYRRQLG